jgi:hypothetical protein
MFMFIAKLAHEVELRDIISIGAMTADHNRNAIVHDFLKSDAEWLFWVDSDTQVPVGAVSRMLSHGRTLVSGLYYGKTEPHDPIAYTVYNGAFAPIDRTLRWERGEILPIDAAGMGCMLTHRSVFEDIQKNYSIYQIPGGGIVPVHKNDIIGDIGTTEKGYHTHEHDGKVYKGQLRLRLQDPTLVNLKFPFFMVEHIRTEDMFFFDLAKRVGHTPVLDTSVECTHLKWKGVNGKDYREIHGS